MSRKQLFRAQVLESAEKRWLGTVRLATPVSQSVWTLAAVAIGLVIVLWLCFGHYTRRQHVTGTLVPRDGLLDVTARWGGTISLVRVKEGDRVKAGDLLVTLSGERVSETLGATSASVSHQLGEQQHRLADDIESTVRLSDEQVDALREQKKNLRDQLVQADQQIAVQNKLVESYRAMLSRIQPLIVKGYISAFQVQQQETAQLDADSQLKGLLKQRLEIEQQLKTAEGQIAQLPLTTASKLNDFHRQSAQVEQSLAQNEADRATEIRAPQDGLITSILARSGRTVIPGEHLLSLMPDNSPLQAQLLVPSSAIGFVRADERVVLRYQAFPYQKFGLHMGHVSGISRSALTADEVSALLGQTTQEAYYRVVVDTDAQRIDVYGRQETLLPGMALDADILLDRRSMMEWMLEPLYGMRRRMENDK